jgi:hypothetical protein
MLCVVVHVSACVVACGRFTLCTWCFIVMMPHNTHKKRKSGKTLANSQRNLNLLTRWAEWIVTSIPLWLVGWAGLVVVFFVVAVVLWFDFIR